MNDLKFLLMALMLATALTSVSEAADDKRAARDREAIRRAQAALRAAEEEKVGLARQLAEAEQRSNDALGKVGYSQRAFANAQKRISELEAVQQATRVEGEATLAQFEALKRDHTSLEAREKAAVAALAQRDRELKDLQVASSRQLKENGLCAERNIRLYGIGREILERYQKKTCLDAALQSDPFTRIKQVEMENLIEDYIDKLGDQRIAPARR
jgi:uncharacterized protein YjhX (UPF0386 family)